MQSAQTLQKMPWVQQHGTVQEDAHHLPALHAQVSCIFKDWANVRQQNQSE